MQQIPGLYFAPSVTSGRGVYCREDISAGSIIEIGPVIVIPSHEVDIIHHTDLHDYYFVWGHDDDQAAIALGYGSLYNHADFPNASYVLDLAENTIDIRAIKNITAGEEITINYHGEPGTQAELWFDEKGHRIKRIKA